MPVAIFFLSGFAISLGSLENQRCNSSLCIICVSDSARIRKRMMYGFPQTFIYIRNGKPSFFLLFSMVSSDFFLLDATIAVYVHVLWYYNIRGNNLLFFSPSQFILFFKTFFCAYLRYKRRLLFDLDPRCIFFL